MTTYKNQLTKFWKLGYYSVSQMRSISTESGTNKKFSYKEFNEVVGITITQYDSNVEQFKELRYKDMVEKGYLTA